MELKTIKQTVIFHASPHIVYELLMNEKKHAVFTESTAKVSRKEGGALAAYDDYIEGLNLEIVPDKKIVQKWRTSDWPRGTYSRVTFTFLPTEGGTRLEMLHEDVPAEFAAEIAQGWIDFYWIPMKKMLKEK